MKKFMLSVLILGTFQVSAEVDGLKAYKSKTGKGVTISDQAFLQAVKSKEPLCVKDGSSVIKMNDAFENMGLKYRDCSQGEGATKKHQALGFRVTVIKLSELSPAMIKAVLKD